MDVNQQNIVSNTVFIFVTMHARYYSLSNMNDYLIYIREKDKKETN